MADAGRYCKAFYMKSLREFPGWHAAVAAEPSVDGSKTQEFGDEDYVFVHDDFTVTRGIFPGQDLVLAQITPEWKTFCTDVLKFAPPA